MITAAAIKRNDKIYTGRRHAQIIQDMVADGCKTPIRGDEQGFVDDAGEFFNRFQARARAKRSGQIPWEFRRELLSEDLW